MRRSVSTRLATTASLFLAASVFSGCCKSYVQATLEPCAPLGRDGLVQLALLDDDGKNEALVAWVADEMLPYCHGIHAILEE